jgi:Mg2+ and Co2+ transporter CorA
MVIQPRNSAKWPTQTVLTFVKRFKLASGTFFSYHRRVDGNAEFDMQIFVYKNGAEKVEEGFSKEELPALLADKSSVIWVDILADTDETVEEAKDVLLNTFGFHPLTVEDCVETRNQPKVEVFPSYLFFIVHGIRLKSLLRPSTI